MNTPSWGVHETLWQGSMGRRWGSDHRLRRGVATTPRSRLVNDRQREVAIGTLDRPAWVGTGATLIRLGAFVDDLVRDTGRVAAMRRGASPAWMSGPKPPSGHPQAGDPDRPASPLLALFGASCTRQGDRTRQRVVAGCCSAACRSRSSVRVMPLWRSAWRSLRPKRVPMMNQPTRETGLVTV